MDDQLQVGRKILDSLFGKPMASGFYAFLEKAKPGFGDYILHSYAEFYEDKTLDLKTKQLIGLACLVSQKNAFLQLRDHILGCQHTGLSKTEVVAAIMHLTMYIGFPTVVNTLEVVNTIYK